MPATRPARPPVDPSLASSNQPGGAASSSGACRRPSAAQRFTASALRLYVGDCTSASLRRWPGDGGPAAVTLSRRDLAHRGRLVSTALLLADHRRASCPDFLDDRSVTQTPVSAAAVLLNAALLLTAPTCGNLSLTPTRSSYRSVDPQILLGNVPQVDHLPNGPTNSAAITTMFPLRLCVGKLLVAVTRERRYGPSRLRINDDDDTQREAEKNEPIFFCVHLF